MPTAGVDDIRQVGKAGVMPFARRISPAPVAALTLASAPPFLLHVPAEVRVLIAGFYGKDRLKP